MAIETSRLACWLAPVIAAAGCGREANAPPGADGRLAGTWIGTLTYEDKVVSAVLWLEEHDGTVAGTAAELERIPTSGELVSAPEAEPCRPLELTAPGTLHYRMPTNLGADAVFAVSLDGATHQLVGEWAADTELVDAGGDVTMSRNAWLPTREQAGAHVPLGCIPRAPTACADGEDDDGDGAADAADLGCCAGASCALVGNREDAEPPCANRLDDDGDGVADALDPECAGPSGLEIGREPVCADGRDNDGDGAIDLDDPACGGNPRHHAEVAPMCSDGVDNDGDGLADARDPQCAALDRESDALVQCANGYDDDGDGTADLDDPSCQGVVPGFDETPHGMCDDGIDNDGDGLVDLAEPTCSRTFPLNEAGDFAAPEDCEDGVDNDADGATDAADTYCFWFGVGSELVEADPLEPPRRPDLCSNGVDDDGDGHRDSADPDCAVDDALGDNYRFEDAPACQNLADDDGDGLVDALDPDCLSLFDFSEAGGCANGVDDDGDGLIDLADPTCAGSPSGTEVHRACADGQDNDGDGTLDAADPDCFAPYDWTEAAACADGRDNDGDRLFDLADPGCAGAIDDDEL